MPANNIKIKVQKALAAYLADKDLGGIPAINIFRGISRGKAAATTTTDSASLDEETEEQGVKLPCVVCDCNRAEQSHPPGGNWKAFAEILIESNADDTTEDDHGEREGVVTGWFMTATIAADLSDSLAGFTALFVIVRDQSYTLEGRKWVSHLSLEIDCIGSDIA